MNEITGLEELAIYAIVIVGALILFGKEEPYTTALVKAEPTAIVVNVAVVADAGILISPAPRPTRWLMPATFVIEAVTIAAVAVEGAEGEVESVAVVVAEEAEGEVLEGELVSAVEMPSLVLAPVKVAAKAMGSAGTLRILSGAIMGDEPTDEPVWNKMTTAQLRKACQDNGIRWRNVHGTGKKAKHLKNAEMIAKLKVHYSQVAVS